MLHKSALAILAPMPGSRLEAEPPEGGVRLSRRGTVAVLTMENGPLNALSAAVRRGLLAAIKSLQAMPDITAAVLAGGGNTFIASGDPREVGHTIAPPELPEVIAAIERCRVPVVAALHGTALGSGFELALACDARVCEAGTVLSLPQVMQGTIPGGGATQRLPRLVGRAVAADIVCSGRRVLAEEAAALGLVDCVLADDLVHGAVEFARTRVRGKRRVRDLPVSLEDEASFREAARRALSEGRNRPQVAAALGAIEISATMPVDAALAYERELFQHLRMSGDARGLRYQSFARRRPSQPTLRSARSPGPRPIRKAGVVGSGELAQELVRGLLEARIEVTLVERDKRLLRKARQAFAKPGPLLSDDLASLGDCDLVIEAVPEDYEAKARVFIALDPVLRRGCLLATTTSGFDIDALASATSRAGQVCGLHFLPRAGTATVVEVVRTSHSAPATLLAASELVRRMHRIALPVGNAFGFVGHRLVRALQAQCDCMAGQGADPAQIDGALRDFGFEMPLRTLVLPLPAEAPRPRALARRPRLPRFEDADIVRRVLLALVNEAACILQDGVAADARDIDVLMVSAFGFPAWEGGPVFWARGRDPQALEAAMQLFLQSESAVERGGPLHLLRTRPPPPALPVDADFL